MLMNLAEILPKIIHIDAVDSKAREKELSVVVDPLWTAAIADLYAPIHLGTNITFRWLDKLCHSKRLIERVCSELH